MAKKKTETPKSIPGIIPDYVKNELTHWDNVIGIYKKTKPSAVFYMDIAIDCTYNCADVEHIGITSPLGESFYAEIAGSPLEDHSIMKNRVTFRRRINGDKIGDIQQYSLIVKNTLPRIKQDIKKWVETERKALCLSSNNINEAYQETTPVTFVLGSENAALKWTAFLNIMCPNGDFRSCPDFISPDYIDLGSMMKCYDIDPSYFGERIDVYGRHIDIVKSTFYEFLCRELNDDIHMNIIEKNELYKSFIIMMRALDIGKLRNGLSVLASTGLSAIFGVSAPSFNSFIIENVRYAIGYLGGDVFVKEDNNESN